MWSSSRRVKEVSIIFGDYFQHSKRKKIKEDTNDPGCHSEGSENTLPLGGLRLSSTINLS